MSENMNLDELITFVGEINKGLSVLQDKLAEKDKRIEELEKFIKNDVIDFIKMHDKVVDGEWGDCRRFEKILEDGDESPIYSEALKVLNKNK